MTKKKGKKTRNKKNSTTEKETRFHFIDREAQENLWKGYAPFLRLIPDLERTCKLVAAQAVDKLNKDSVEDMSIWGLLRYAMDDFHEICVLCANGLPQGADKILRGMFERTVTAWYLDANPNEAQAFWDYQYVREYKDIQRIKESDPEQFESMRNDGLIDPAKYQALEDDYNRVKDQFKTPKCEKCKQNPMPSWTRKDLVSMTKQVKEKVPSPGTEPQLVFDMALISGYYAPMQYVHATSNSIVNRGNDNEPRTRLMTAHYLVIRALELAARRFNLNCLADVMNCGQALQSVWPNLIPDVASQKSQAQPLTQDSNGA